MAGPQEVLCLSLLSFFFMSVGSFHTEWKEHIQVQLATDEQVVFIEEAFIWMQGS